MYRSISIKKEIYDLLKDKKGKKSFSTVIETMLKGFQDIDDNSKFVAKISGIESNMMHIDSFLSKHSNGLYESLYGV